ncbi:MAG: hypothetical protein Q8K30_02635 [Candidatus Gracilibacteria bacterium]|nr:hypothetical protein [Candidatus Gracilibacteria bacterium]
MYTKNSNEFLNKSIKIIIKGNIYGISKEELIKNIVKDYNGDIKNIIDIIRNIEGIYVIIINDFKTNNTFIINDKLGLYPYYYKKIDNKIIHKNDIIKLSNIMNHSYLNLKSILEIMQLGYITKNKTIIKGIKKISPGSILSISYNNEVSESKYFNLKAINNTNIEKIYDNFKKGVEKRVMGEKMYSDLSGGFDSRLIMLTLIKELKQINIIFITNKYYDIKDTEISKVLANKLGLNHLIYEDKSVFDNHLYGFSGLCGGELLGNSLMKEWFEYENIEEYLIDKNTIIKSKNINYGIKSFIKNILRSEINTVQGNGWLNPINQFKSNLLLPFLDTDFLNSIIGLEIDELKNYKTYKNIYEKYFNEFLDIKYTFNSEREGVNNIEEEFLYFKNYKLNKNEYIKIVIFNKNNFVKSNLSKLFNYKIIYKKPLELYGIIKFIEKINNIKGNK